MVSQNVHASFLFFRCQSFIFKSGKSKCSYTARTRNTVKNYSILPCYHCITRPQLGLREGDNQRGEVIITSRENHHLAVILVANLAPCVYGYAQRHQTTTTRRSPGFRVWLRVTVWRARLVSGLLLIAQSLERSRQTRAIEWSTRRTPS